MSIFIDGEITPLAHMLLEGGAAVVFHSASPIPAEITARHGPMIHCMKPMVSDHVVARLVEVLESPRAADAP